MALRFPAKINSSCIGLPYLLIELFYIVTPVARTDGLLGGRAVYGQVITIFSRIGRLLHFLTHGAELGRFARESSTTMALDHRRLIRPGKNTFYTSRLR